jgi:hypothetical protein
MSLQLFFDNYQKPEYTKEEHPMAALYRLVGFENNLTNHFYVVEQERKFLSALKERKRLGFEGPYKEFENEFEFILKCLELPKKKHGKERLSNYYPYIPELSLVGNLPRDTQNAYNLGLFLKKTIEFGIESESEGEILFGEIFESLTVKNSTEEDVFSILLSQEIKDWFDLKDNQVIWNKQPIPIDFNNWNSKGIDCPAKALVLDLKMPGL